MMNGKVTVSINLKNFEKRSMKILSDAEVEELKEAFNLLDVEGTGYIDPKEIHEVMKSLGLDSTKPFAYSILAGLDIEEKKEGITFKDFLEAIKSGLSCKDEERIEKAFRMFDYDGSGSINLANLIKMAKELGENVNPEELREVILKIAKNEDSITRQEFYNIMMDKGFN